MLVFIDESGDTGFAIEKGATTHFTMCMVVFEDEDEALACDQRIDLLRRELKLASLYEFRFHRNSDRIRDKFLKAMLPYQFFYYGIVIKKVAMLNEILSLREPFYNYAASLLFENAKEKLHQAIVVIDQSGHQLFKYQLATYLKRKINTDTPNRYIKKVKMQDSKRNNLLQLADMVTGAVHRSMAGEKKDAQRFREIIKPREIYAQIWPK